MVKCPGVYTFFSSVEVPHTGFCTSVIYFLLTYQTIVDKTVQYSNSFHKKKKKIMYGFYFASLMQWFSCFFS